ncbi:MAG: response regulator transcription factor [Chthoniobacteraceae bacterium]
MKQRKPTAKPPAPARRHRIFLVDDHPIVLSGFKLLLDAQPDLEVCGTAGSAEEALQRAPGSDADLIITDLTLPGRDGLELIRDILAVKPGQAVLVVSMHDELLYAERALRSGARGFLMKEAGSEKMLAAIRHVLAGNVYVSERMSARILDTMSGNRARPGGSPVQKLSDREFEVFRMLGEGLTTKQIAERLHLSAKTVAVHRGHIKEKLGVKSATELMHHAVRWVESR